MNSRPVYIAMGSNVGDRAAMFARAIDALNCAGLRVSRRSSLYETEPVGGPPQPWFLNAVVETQTDLDLPHVLDILQEIERDMGRQRSIPSGPRTLDLDILLDGETVFCSDGLEVPHPRLAQRRFVLAPLAELAPALVHPVLHKTVAELLRETASGDVRLWNPADRGASPDG